MDNGDVNAKEHVMEHHAHQDKPLAILQALRAVTAQSMPIVIQQPNNVYHVLRIIKIATDNGIANAKEHVMGQPVKQEQPNNAIQPILLIAQQTTRPNIAIHPH